jgi:hypothetical protein
VFAIGYGLLHDRITYSISREYFVIGKALPSAAYSFSRDVVLLASQAAWSVGLLVGLAFLVANRPRALRPQLPYSMLLKLLAVPLVTSMVGASALGWIGFLFANTIANLVDFDYLELQEPARFCATWGIHTGTYVGAIAGIAIACVRILSLRRDAAPA